MNDKKLNDLLFGPIKIPKTNFWKDDIPQRLTNLPYLKLMKKSDIKTIREQLVYLKNNVMLTMSEYGATNLSLYYTNLYRDSLSILLDKLKAKREHTLATGDFADNNAEGYSQADLDLMYLDNEISNVEKEMKQCT